MVEAYLRQIEAADREVADLDVRIKKGALHNAEARRLQTMPGIGPMSAMAIQAFCPPAQNFQMGRHFAASLGLVPRQRSTVGKDRPGRITKMGQRTLSFSLATCFRRSSYQRIRLCRDMSCLDRLAHPVFG